MTDYFGSEERINKAKVQIQLRYPFFGYLSMYLKTQPMEPGFSEYGVVVDPRGVLYYDPEYIQSLSTDEVVGLICHEILHLSLSHLLRRNERQKEKWDLATDLCTNAILSENDFILPSNATVPRKEDNYSIQVDENTTIEDCNKKSSEEIYLEIPDPKQDKKPKKGKQKSKGGQGQCPSSGKGDSDNQDKEGGGNSDGQGNGGDSNQDKDNNNNSNSPNSKPHKNRFDDHLEDNNQQQQKEKAPENDWDKKTAEALVFAKSIGKEPLGLDRLIAKLREERIDWKEILRRYIQSMIPVDYSWARPSKKSGAIGMYFPNTVREKLDICIAIDTSGSIGQVELQEFLSEISAIYRHHQEVITMRILSHDVDVHTDELLNGGGSIDFTQINVKGGGGTSHIPVMKYLNEEVEDCSLAVFFTDGYSDLNEIDLSENKFESLFVISEQGTEHQFEGKDANIIKIPKGYYTEK